MNDGFFFDRFKVGSMLGMSVTLVAFKQRYQNPS